MRGWCQIAGVLAFIMAIVSLISGIVTVFSVVTMAGLAGDNSLLIGRIGLSAFFTLIGALFHGVLGAILFQLPGWIARNGASQNF